MGSGLMYFFDPARLGPGTLAAGKPDYSLYAGEEPEHIEE